MTDWIARAQDLRPHTQLFIAGEFCDATDGSMFPSTNPRDGSPLASISSGTAQDVDVAVRSGHDAFERGVWRHAGIRNRQRAISRLAELMRENLEELALLECLDSGRPIANAVSVDVPSAARVFRWYAELLDKVYDDIAPTDRDALALVTREPLGVIGAVVPWNYPLIITAWKVAPALAAGNSVVLKPAELTSLSALRLAELAVEAGIPPGVFNVVPGTGEVAGQALGRHELVDKIAFTGSPEVGRAFLRYAGESNGKQVSLELGGKSPQVVLADVIDIEACATAVAWGIFYNAGQTCHGGSRLVVHEDVRDELMESVHRIAQSLKVGDPLDPETQIGAIASPQQFERVMGYIELARSESATVHGGRPLTLQGLEGGHYIEPTIFEGVDSSSRVWKEEIFGPALTVATVSDVAQAIAVANDSAYGLAASVWTASVTTAHRAAQELRAGTVWVNTYDAADVITPFGGVKQSGSGRDRAVQALHANTALKTTWINLGDDAAHPI